MPDLFFSDTFLFFFYDGFMRLWGTSGLRGSKSQSRFQIVMPSPVDSCPTLGVIRVHPKEEHMKAFCDTDGVARSDDIIKGWERVETSAPPLKFDFGHPSPRRPLQARDPPRPDTPPTGHIFVSWMQFVEPSVHFGPNHGEPQAERERQRFDYLRQIEQQQVESEEDDWPGQWNHEVIQRSIVNLAFDGLHCESPGPSEELLSFAEGDFAGCVDENGEDLHSPVWLAEILVAQFHECSAENIDFEGRRWNLFRDVTPGEVTVNLHKVVVAKLKGIQGLYELGCFKRMLRRFAKDIVDARWVNIW